MENFLCEEYWTIGVLIADFDATSQIKFNFKRKKKLGHYD